MSWKKILRKINRAASVAKDIEAIVSGDPKKIARRAKNKIKGRLLWKLFRWI